MFPCFQENSYLKFTESTSYAGICCSFNYRPKNSSYEPYRSPSFGTRGGLSIIGSAHPQVSDGKSGIFFSSGLMMLIHHPFDYPVEGNQMKLIEIGVVTSVAIYPILSHCSDDVLALSVKSRQCIEDSTLGYQYRQPACTVTCTRNVIYEKCKCHPFYMPLPQNGPYVRNCLAVDAECFSKYFCKVFLI